VSSELSKESPLPCSLLLCRGKGVLCCIRCITRVTVHILDIPTPFSNRLTVSGTGKLDLFCSAIDTPAPLTNGTLAGMALVVTPSGPCPTPRQTDQLGSCLPSRRIHRGTWPRGRSHSSPSCTGLIARQRTHARTALRRGISHTWRQLLSRVGRPSDHLHACTSSTHAKITPHSQKTGRCGAQQG